MVYAFMSALFLFPWFAYFSMRKAFPSPVISNKYIYRPPVELCKSIWVMLDSEFMWEEWGYIQFIEIFLLLGMIMLSFVLMCQIL